MFPTTLLYVFRDIVSFSAPRVHTRNRHQSGSVQSQHLLYILNISSKRLGSEKEASTSATKMDTVQVLPVGTGPLFDSGNLCHPPWSRTSLHWCHDRNDELTDVSVKPLNTGYEVLLLFGRQEWRCTPSSTLASWWVFWSAFDMWWQLVQLYANSGMVRFPLS